MKTEKILNLTKKLVAIKSLPADNKSAGKGLDLIGQVLNRLK